MNRQGETAVAVSLTSLATLLPFATSLGILAAGGIAAVLLTAMALARRMVAAGSVGVLLVAFLLLKFVGLGPKRLVFGLAFVLYLVVRSRLPWLREIAPWRHAGSCDLRHGAVGAAIGLLAGLVLWAWYEKRPEQLAEVVEYVRGWPTWAIVLCGALASAVVAGLEETVYRGVVQDSLEKILEPRFTALFLQAAVFAALHFPTGILQGLVGVGLVFPYGLLLGVLRRRSGGLTVPIIAHFSTDLVIVGIVLSRTGA